MDPFSGSGSWNMIPSIPSHSSSPGASSQDNLFLSPQHQQQFYQQPTQYPQLQQQQQQQQQQQPQFQQQQNRTPPQQQQQQQQPQQQQQQQQNQHHQSLASNFHLLDLMENLADAIENGTRDQQSDALVNELSNHFDKCQHLLSSISESLDTKAMTVEGQRQKLQESEQLLNQRKELIDNYVASVEGLIESEP